jgi:enoyl-CoA hydratase/carnithine racemase
MNLLAPQTEGEMQSTFACSAAKASRRKVSTMAEVEISRSGAVLELTFNRPAKKNALTSDMYRILVAGLEEAESDVSIGAVLIKGEGGVFTAGNDIADFARAAQGAEPLAAVAFVRKIAGFSKPIVACVEGLAVGVGVTLLLHCDLIYVAPDAKFSLPFVNLGLLPEAGSSLLLPRRVGMARASAWLLLAESFDAGEALSAGLVNAIVPNESLVEFARGKAAALTAKPRAALLHARAFLRGDRDEVLARIDAELAAFAVALKTPQAQAALAAFLNKSK